MRRVLSTRTSNRYNIMKLFKFVGVFVCAVLLTACGHDTGLEMPDSVPENNSSEITAENSVPEFLENVTWDRLRLMSAAIAPYTMETPENQIPTVRDALLSAEWEEIDADTPIPDGENYSAFIYNNSSPFRLIFYGDHTVDFDNGDSQRKYRVSSEAYEAVVNTVNCDNVYDYLIWNEVENVNPQGIWISDSPSPEESQTEEASENIDVSEIPDGAAYKCTEYLVLNDTPILNSISYCDANGNEIRSFSYLDDELANVLYLENEYDSEGRLVSTRQKNESFSEYVDSDESFCEFEYYENGDMKKLSLHDGDKTTTVEFVYEYDDDGRAVVVEEYWNGSDELFSTTYKTYDENGNVITENIKFEKTGLEINSTYQYDEKGRPLIQKDIDSDYRYSKFEYEDYN